MRKPHFFSIGSGIILSAVFLRVLPESIHIANSELIPPLILGGVIVSIFLDKINFLKKDHISRESLACWECDEPFSYKISVGLGMHYLIDGFFLGGFLLSSKSYLVVILLIAVHKFLDGFILSLIYSGHDIRKSMKFISIISTSNLIGFILAIIGINIEGIAIVFAPVSAGILTYVAIHDFIPVFNSTSDLILFFIGVLISGILINFIPH
jgi:zinc transporter ZupT